MDRPILNPQIDPLLLPFLQTTDEAETQLRLDRLIDLAAPTIKKITRWSQDPEDAFQDTAQRLVEQLRNFKADPEGRAIGNYFHYVKVVASHVAKGQLRDSRRPRRSLVDALRYVLKNNPRFELWEGENREGLCGLAAWRHQPVIVTRSARLLELLDNSYRFGEVVLPTCDLQSLNHGELLDEIFKWVGHPIRYKDLARIVSELKLAKDFPPIVGTGENEGRPLSEILPAAGPLPDELAEWSEFLGQLWVEIEQLPRMQRLAYLLNFTAGEGQLELFRIYGVVSIRGIGAALQLTDDQFVRVWPELPLSDEERRRAEAATSYDEKFMRLWLHLPLTDATLAKILGTERQKVINLRKAAGNRLSRRLAHRGQAG